MVLGPEGVYQGSDGVFDDQLERANNDRQRKARRPFLRARG